LTAESISRGSAAGDGERAELVDANNAVVAATACAAGVVADCDEEALREV